MQEYLADIARIRSLIKLPVLAVTCDRCGLTYDDEGSVRMCVDGAEDWKAMCEKDRVKARGLAPCPILTCKGEMIAA